MPRSCCGGRVRWVTNSCRRNRISLSRQSGWDPGRRERNFSTRASKSMAQGACNHCPWTSRSWSGVLLLWRTWLRFPACRCVSTTGAGRGIDIQTEGSDLWLWCARVSMESCQCPSLSRRSLIRKTPDFTETRHRSKSFCPVIVLAGNSVKYWEETSKSDLQSRRSLLSSKNCIWSERI